MKYHHEIRDPIHAFIKFDRFEKRLINSCPFQRLRNIHQLAMTYLVYPGATHKRFEHSLGVMELASKVFDVIINPQNTSDDIKNSIINLNDDTEIGYWRKIVRAAALCHDIGHLPFSHAAEKELLPKGVTHESITQELIFSDELMDIWDEMKPRLDPNDIAKIAVGAKEAKNLGKFDVWDKILSEIITGNIFGVDRMDYLLRDSCHTGVAYGKFDIHRLIDTLRILKPQKIEGEEKGLTPVLGVEFGGIHSAEALLLARYFMFTQVYLHPVRRIYDIHLKDFLKLWLKDGTFDASKPYDNICSDVEVLTELNRVLKLKKSPNFNNASHIVNRTHYKVVYSSAKPEDILIKKGEKIYDGLCAEVGEDNVKYDSYISKEPDVYFPVKMDNGEIESSKSISHILGNFPAITIETIYANRSILNKANEYIRKNS